MTQHQIRLRAENFVSITHSAIQLNITFAYIVEDASSQCSLVTDFLVEFLNPLLFYLLLGRAHFLSFRKILKAIYFLRTLPSQKQNKESFFHYEAKLYFWLRHTFLHELYRAMRLKNGTTLANEMNFITENVGQCKTSRCMQFLHQLLARKSKSK